MSILPTPWETHPVLTAIVFVISAIRKKKLTRKNKPFNNFTNSDNKGNKKMMDLITKLEENINNFFSSIATLRYEEHKKRFYHNY